MDLFRKCMDPVERVLSDAKMDKGSVNDVVLVRRSGVEGLGFRVPRRAPCCAALRAPP